MTKLFSNLILLLLLTFALWSCNNDDPQTPEIKGTLTVAKAKEWYENFVMKNSLSNQMKAKIARNAVDSLQPLLNWDMAELDNDSVWSVVELPWEYKDYTVQISNSEVSEYATLQNDKSVIKQVIRLVILQNRKTGETYGFKMVVVPDLDYMLRKDDAIAENKYLQRGGDLSGAVLFYSVNDVFINGWKYENGKITAKILPENGSAVKKDDSNRFNASAGWNYIRIQTCYYHYSLMGGVVSDLKIDECNIVYLPFYTIDGVNGGGGGIDNTSSDLNGGSIAGTTSSSTDKPVDCANVAGGTAYRDKCERCVGGTTGKNACSDCEYIDYMLNKIYNENTSIQRIITPDIVLSKPTCCNSGYINKNGKCVLWSGIIEGDINGTSIIKYSYNHDAAVSFLISKIGASGQMADKGLDLFPGSSVIFSFSIGQILSLISKIKEMSTVGIICSVAMAAWEYKFSRIKDLYTDLLTKFTSNENSEKGLYVLITSEYIQSIYGNGSMRYLEEYYNSDGCLIGIIGY